MTPPPAPPLRVAVTMGDPGGIGPEIVVRALLHAAERYPDIAFVVHGSSSAMLGAAETMGIEPFWWRVDARADACGGINAGVTLLDADGMVEDRHGADIGGTRFTRRPSSLGGALSFRWVEDAIESARVEKNPVSAIVTAPISKEAWHLAGHKRFPGHTELLASRFNAKRFIMMFEGPRLRVSLATVHVPLFDVRDVLTIGRIHDAIDLGAEGCRLLGIASPRIAVCGLNPHAGEAGFLGDEEQRLIEPAINVAVENGLDVRGPFPGDTVFGRAVDGEFDLVVAMYHDQGLIPVKLLDRDSSVNMTVGLPVIRTSPDHGTAFDIAGTGRADAGSMLAAIETAVKIAKRRQATG